MLAKKSSLLYFLAAAFVANAADFSNHKLFTATPKSEADLQVLRDLDGNVPEDVIDFWSEAVEVGASVEFLVDGAFAPEVSRILTEANVENSIKVDGFQRMIDEQMKQIWDEDGKFILRSPGQLPNPRKDFNLFNYHDLDAIYSYISQV